MSNITFRTIVVPMDFSPEAQSALEYASELARSAGPSHLILAHAYFLPVEMEAMATEQNVPIVQLVSDHASKQLEEMLVKLQEAGVSSEFVVSRGYPEAVIVELAKDKNADLIVMGTRGRTGLAHIALGSIAERVVQRAPCPVITLKGEDE